MTWNKKAKRSASRASKRTEASPRGETRRRRPVGDPASVMTLRMTPAARVRLGRLVRRVGVGPQSSVLRWVLNLGVDAALKRLDEEGVVEARVCVRECTTTAV